MSYYLPPYGILTGAAPLQDEPPRAWLTSNPGKSTADWIAFVDRLAAELGGSLWPVFRAGASPAGVEIDARVDRLLEADFRMIGALQHERIYDRMPGAAAGPGSLDHKQLFALEDAGRLGESLGQYDDTFEYSAARLLPALILNGLTDTAGSFVLQMKKRHQRLRAYQAAMLLPQYGADFFHIEADSAQTPAFISGHCLQSLMGMAAAALALAGVHYTVTPQQRLALMQYASDIGDRRVFAGVHYPSDNLGSWIAALRLCAEITDGRQLGQFVAGAIPLSAIHQRMQAQMREPDSPYAAAMTRLQELIDANA